MATAYEVLPYDGDRSWRVTTARHLAYAKASMDCCVGYISTTWRGTLRRWSKMIVVFLTLIVLGTIFFHTPKTAYPEVIGKLKDDWPFSKKIEPPPVKTPPPPPITNMTVIGLVFYGRKSRVQMLECYVRQNLKENGGVLDEVHWVPHTDNVNDLVYLNSIINNSPSYRRVELEPVTTSPVDGQSEYDKQQYGAMWSHLQRNTLYIKIDDDVIYIEAGAIKSIVKTKMAHPEAFMVSANVVNSPLMGWMHFHMGALQPYLPESAESALNQTQNDDRWSPSWRASLLPSYSGADNDYWMPDQPPPYEHHRWLPLRHQRKGIAMAKTPASLIEYHPFGSGWHSWAIDAQQHYSFFENLENHNLHLYNMGKPWDATYERLSINFVCVQGDDIIDNGPIPRDDEEYLTVEIPRKLSRSVIIDTNAIVSHYSFSTQQGIESTDVLMRYQNLADETVCHVN